MKHKNKRLLLGKVAVDAAKLVIADPTYIDEFWYYNAGDKRSHAVIYEAKDGSKWACSMHAPPAGVKLFLHFESIIKEYGKTANELIAEKFFVPVKPPKPAGEFSTFGAAAIVNFEHDKQGGQLLVGAGLNAGVVFRSGYGDGEYPVYATYGVDGYIKKIEIEF